MTWNNSDTWQKNSDGWVETMNKSKEDKEKYRKYADKTEQPIPYRKWLKDRGMNLTFNLARLLDD